ncbi:MAG: hypothetical protein IJO88_06645, partial [Oscillospiraceae bacterium]|nr:hypothetical protein [Oscillospiraceae bacterium]
MKKRIVSLLLAMVMILSVIPAALADGCEHGSTTATVNSNGDKTHTTVVTCDDCGAVIEQDASADVIAIDFKADAEAMSQQSWWNDLAAVSTADGNDAKRIGAARGSAMSDTETAAYNAMDAWLEENAAWSFVMPEWEDNTNQSAKDGKRAYLSADADVAWGLSLHTYVINGSSGSQHTLNVKVEEAGLYDLALDIIPQTNESSDCADDGGVFPGGATIDVYVNGALVIDDSTAPKGEEGAVTTAEDVPLNAGDNTIVIDIVSNYANISGYGNRVNVPLAGLSLTKPAACEDASGDGKCDLCGYVTGECKHMGEKTSEVISNGNGTHTTVVTCADCGGVADSDATEKLVDIDFKADVKAMAQQDFWADLASVTTLDGNDAKRVGAMNRSVMSETEKAAYEQMQAWLREHASWSFHMPDWDNDNDNGKRAYLSADDDLAWGLSLHTYVIGVEDYSDLSLNVTVPETGYYDLTLDLKQQDNTSTDSVDDTVVFPGGARITVYANGTAVLENSDIAKGTERVQYTIENVYLKKGSENVITFLIVTNWAGGTSPYGNRVNVPLCGMQIEKAASCTDMDGNDVCDVCGGSFVCEHVDIDKNYTTAGEETHTVSGTCDYCGEAVQYEETCTDEDLDLVCDLCGGAVSCKHPQRHAVYVNTGVGTHNKVVLCSICEDVVEENTGLFCINEDEDDLCDLCDGSMTCEHEGVDVTTEYVDNGDGTHVKTVVCTCGETVSETTEPCTDADGDGYCDGCEAVVDTECSHIDEDKDCYCDLCDELVKEITKAAFAGSNMTLGNELEVNFLMVKKNLPAGDYTAVITQKMADGTDRVTEIAMADWGTMGSYHKISARIAAREMADDLYIEIKDAEGYVYNNEYFTSVRGYAGRALASSTTTDYVRIMMIDMLNYGAAAQNHFKYNTADLA